MRRSVVSTISRQQHLKDYVKSESLTVEAFCFIIPLLVAERPEPETHRNRLRRDHQRPAQGERERMSEQLQNTDGDIHDAHAHPQGKIDFYEVELALKDALVRIKKADKAKSKKSLNCAVEEDADVQAALHALAVQTINLACALRDAEARA